MFLSRRKKSTFAAGALIPATLFLAVFCISQFLQRFTLAQMANNGLFLLTPDWFREVLTGAHPVSETVASFLVQFYDMPVAGALIVASVITLTYLALDVLFRRCRLPIHRLLALLGALACWFFTERLASNLIPVMVMLIAAGLALLSLIVRKKDEGPAARWELPVALVLTLCVAALIGTDANTTVRERLAKAQYNAGMYRWDKVLEAATPDNAARDPRLRPYAFLALGETGQLGDRMFKYPVMGPEDFGEEGDNSLSGYLFKSLLNECLHIPNEAIHQIFQYSASLPHGMSHLSLYQLIKYNLEAGNYTMARKYAEILRHSPRSSSGARSVLRTYADAVDAVDTVGHSSAYSPVFTKDPMLNLAQMDMIGRSTNHSSNRFLCYLLLYGELENFKRLIEPISWPNGKIPVHYQEALLISEIDPEYWGIDKEVLKRFNAFTKAVLDHDNAAIQKTATGTYWGYYILIKDRELSERDSGTDFPAS